MYEWTERVLARFSGIPGLWGSGVGLKSVDGREREGTYELPSPTKHSSSVPALIFDSARAL